MKQKDFAVYVAAFLLVFSSVIHFASAQEKSSDVFKDKYNVKYKVTQLDSPVQEILWCGTAQATSEDGDEIKYDSILKVRKLFVLTTQGGVYFSGDYGFTYKQINKDLLSVSNTNSTIIKINDIMISPVKNKKVFFFSTSGESFYTDNCGTSYNAFNHHASINNIQPHPTDPNTLIGTVPLNCQSTDAECNSSTSDLLLTQDNGSTWRTIGNYIDQAQWDKTKQTLQNTQNRIIVAHYTVERDDKGEIVQKRKVSLTDNFGVEYRLVEKNGLRFYQNEDYIFILKQGKSFGQYKLSIGPAYISTANTRNDIDLPIQRVKDESFTVLDSDNGQIYIAINHEGDSSGYTNVYISNQEGKQFNLSLQYTVGDNESNIDFEPIDSNEGAYITNTYTASSVAQYQKVLKRKQGQKSTGTDLAVDNFKIENMKKTKITFNRGGDWHSVKAPEFNYAGNPIKCSGDCSLNFKGRTDSQGTPIYSTDNAPGIVLATGNHGYYLTNNLDEVRTYLSIDGGHNWKEVQVGSHEYEIADQGGIIAMARDDRYTNEVIYSIDEGETWRKLDFKAENKFIVEDFVTEESNDEKTFLFYGKKTGANNQQAGVIGAINFSNLFKKDCEGFETANEPDSDYVKWTPENYSGKKCIFGSKISYIRKKPDAECFNNRKVSDARMIVGQCECTEEDFECDYGYVKDSVDDNKCVPMNAKFAKKSTEPPAFCSDYYYVSVGKRKIANNNCKGGVEELYAKQKLKCPGKENTEPNTSQSSQNKPNNLNSKDGLFNRGTDEIQKEISKQYGNNNGTQNVAGQGLSFVTILAIFIILFVLYVYRQEITAKVKVILSSRAAEKKEKDRYGYNQQSNNAEQYSLFHNDEENDYDADQL